MGLISEIFSGGAKGVFEGIGSLAKDIRIAITGKDPEKMAEIEQKLLEIEFAAQKAQTDINLEEAKHPNIFVSGWRPACGWICAFGLFYHFILSSLIEWGVRILKLEVQPPTLDTENLIVLLFALLGVGGMRTFEKIKNAEGNR